MIVDEGEAKKGQNGEQTVEGSEVMVNTLLHFMNSGNFTSLKPLHYVAGSIQEGWGWQKNSR